MYLLASRSAGAPIGHSVVMTAGEGIVRVSDGSLLAKHVGHIEITKTWATSLLKE